MERERTGAGVDHPEFRHPTGGAPLSMFSKPAAEAISGAVPEQAEAGARFDESLEVALNLGTDPRRGDQAVRGAATLPHGTGKAVRVGVFAGDPDVADMARAAGAAAMAWRVPLLPPRPWLEFQFRK